MDLTFNSRMEEYYQRFIDLQDKLRKSEEERLKLEIKFNELLQVSREEEQAHYKKLRSQYKRFLDEDRKRQERNEKILRTLERIETRVNALMSKSERFKLLKRQYQNYLSRLSHFAEPEKLQDRKLDLPSESTTTFDHPSVQKALQKSNDEKLELLDKYLHSLQSQNVKNDFSFQKEFSQIDPPKDLELLEAISDRLNRNFDSNKATSIAEEIMNSIYSRHYKKDVENERIVQFDKHNGKYDSDDDDYVPKTSNELSKQPTDNKKTGSVLEHILNKKANLTTYKNPTSEKPSYFKTYNSSNETDNNLSNAYSKPSIEDVFTEPAYELQNPINSSQNATIDNIPTIDTGYKDYNVVKQTENDSRYSDIETSKFDVSETSQKPEPNKSISQPTICKTNEEDINNLNYYSEGPVVINETVENNQLPIIISPTDLFDKHNIYVSNQNKETEQNMSKKQDTQVPKTLEEPNQSVDGQHINESEQAEYLENAQASKYSKVEEPAESDYSIKRDENVQPVQPQTDFQNQQFNVEHPPQQNDNVQQFHDIQPVELIEPNDQAVQQYGDYQHTLEQYNEGEEFNQNIQPTGQYDDHGQPIQYQDGTNQQYYDENNQQIGYQQQYDESGQPIQHFDENGQPVQQYDENGQPIQHYNYQYEESSQMRYQHQYDEHGQPISQYDENGQLILPYQPQYDENGQLIQQFDEQGQPIHTYQQQYGENGQLIPQQYNEHGQIIQQQYDEHGQILQQQYVENVQPIQQQYDESGQPIQQQYEENVQSIQQQYDENGQPIQAYGETGQVDQQFEENPQMHQPGGEQQQVQQEHFGEEVMSEHHLIENAAAAKTTKVETGDKKKVLDILDTDTESTKQNTSKISNDSDFDFSNG